MTADRIETTARADRFTAPITFDFGPHVEPIARAGYAAYHQGLPHRPWESLKGHETHRWKLATEDVFSRSTITPERIRAVYLTGYTVDPWDDLASRFRSRWMAVCVAMTGARNGWVTRQDRARRQAAPAGEVADVAA